MKKIERPYTNDELCKVYLEEKLSTKQISERYGIAIYLVQKDLARLKIGRSLKEAAEVCGITKKIEAKELYEYYIVQNHTTDETASHFGVNERTIRRRLKQYNISKSLELQLIASRRVQTEKYGSMFVQSPYYRKKVDAMVEHVRQTCLKKYGVDWISKNPLAVDKARQTFIRKYGVPFYTQTLEYHSKSKRFYKFEGQMFDSSWELAFWIYCKDHNKDIQRCPCSFDYFVGNKAHKYFPDFLCEGELIEIKGDFYLNENSDLVEYNSQNVSELTLAKTKCMREHGVKVYSLNDMSCILDYVFKTYGRSYLKSFQIRKK